MARIWEVWCNQGVDGCRELPRTIWNAPCFGLQVPHQSRRHRRRELATAAAVWLVCFHSLTSAGCNRDRLPYLEIDAIRFVKVVATLEVAYKSRHGQYADLATLAGLRHVGRPS